MARLELKVPPPVILAIFAAAVAALPRIVPQASLPFPGQRAIAIACIVLGIGIAATGVRAFRRARTTINPLDPDAASSLVTTGIYRWTRNPMYLGMAACLLGIACWRSTLPGYLLVPGFCAYMSRFQIGPEERALAANFGQQFGAYSAKVRRWL